MNGQTPHTINELYIWINGKIENIEKDIKYLRHKNRNVFNVLVGLAIIVNTLAIIYFNYK